MTSKQLTERIDKKQIQIDKLNKKLAKLNAKNSEEGFIKEWASWYSDKPKTITSIDQLVELRMQQMGSTEEVARLWFESAEKNFYKNVLADIKSTEKELTEAENQLANYKAQLKDDEEKSSIQKIKVIQEFLDNWGDEVIDYVVENVRYVNKYLQARKEVSDLVNNKIAYYSFDTGKYEDEYLNKLEELRAKRDSYKNMITPLAMTFYDTKSENNLDMPGLKEAIEKDKDRKYWKMIEKVQAITGEITDAKGLDIGAKGDLEGLIIGKQGKAHVRTIGAGGYNQGVVVNVKHGQIFHYRLIVTEVK